MREYQNYGSNPLSVRDSGFYKNEYVDGFVKRWDDLIDWKNRIELEGNFLVECLRKRNVRHVLDVATGTGFHSINLIESGFDVTSVDGSQEMLAQALANGYRRGVTLETVLTDWRKLTCNVQKRFDAVICMGNSFTFLFEDHDRRNVLAEFYSVLQPNGVLILDHRNYDAILEGKYNVTNPGCYSGQNIRVEPEYVDSGLARFVYEFPDGKTFHLNMCPIRKSYIGSLLEESGFQHLEVFEDFNHQTGCGEPGFYIHVADKNNAVGNGNAVGKNNVVGTVGKGNVAAELDCVR